MPTRFVCTNCQGTFIHPGGPPPVCEHGLGQREFRYNVAVHEFGHMIGLPDEYENPDTGPKLIVKKNYSKLVARAKLLGPTFSSHTSSMMSDGMTTLNWHYVTVWEALGALTGEFLYLSAWAIHAPGAQEGFPPPSRISYRRRGLSADRSFPLHLFRPPRYILRVRLRAAKRAQPLIDLLHHWCPYSGRLHPGRSFLPVVRHLASYLHTYTRFTRALMPQRTL